LHNYVLKYFSSWSMYYDNFGYLIRDRKRIKSTLWCN